MVHGASDGWTIKILRGRNDQPERRYQPFFKSRSGFNAPGSGNNPATVKSSVKPRTKRTVPLPPIPWSK